MPYQLPDNRIFKPDVLIVDHKILFVSLCPEYNWPYLDNNIYFDVRIGKGKIFKISIIEKKKVSPFGTYLEGIATTIGS